jgi:hypothetical protein
MKRGGRHLDRSGFGIVEEATHLLRFAPAATLATYYLGSIPFVLGFLYFWSDMARNPFAGQHVAEASLIMTALFLWMKFCQALFAARLRSQLSSIPMPRWSFRQCLRVAIQQALIQPSGLFLLPLAIILTPAFGWVYAFYQNATVLADPASESSTLIRKAGRQATLWPFSNHVALAIVLAFGFFVFIDLLAVILWAPSLVKMLLGIESDFSRSPLALLNTTLFAAVLWMAYLCIDPLLKTLYVVRCFYGESLQSGEDLKTNLKEFAVSSRHFAAILLIALSLAFSSMAIAAPPPAPAQPPPPAQLAPAELDQKIEEVIHQDRYTWRMPRSTALPERESGFLTRFIEGAGRLVRSAVRTVVRWIERLLEFIFGSPTARSSGSGVGLMTRSLPYVLLLLGLGLLAFLLLRVWRRQTPSSLPVAAEAIQAVDIGDEGVGADQLPEDGWTRLAREMLDRGEFRLAMRAFFLSSLAHLANRDLIGLARFKSNRDYERELGRRGHAIPQLLSLFGENLFVFERIWYGAHEVHREHVLQFAANVDRIRSCA